MGFLPISLGVMLLYDLQIGLRAPGGEVYAIVDVFPNVLGLALILWGLIRLAKRAGPCKTEIICDACMTLFSVFVLVKDTLLYARFYAGGTESAAGQCVGFCQHILLLGLLTLVFRKTGSVLSDLGEAKLARAHIRMTSFALMEGLVYVVCFILGMIGTAGFLLTFLGVLRMLDMLLWLFIVWYGGINQLRAALRAN